MNNTRARIGNDVVDLSQLETRDKWRDARFVARVFAPPEQRLIANEQSDRTLWTLWSAKEAAYKAISKQDGLRPLAREILVVPNSKGMIGYHSGRAHWREVKLSTSWRHGANSIHCTTRIAGQNNDDEPEYNMQVDLRGSPSDFEPAPLSPRETLSARNEHSAAARQLAKWLLRTHDNTTYRGLEIIRPQLHRGFAAPRFEDNGRPLTGWDLSLSHHGNIVGAAILRCTAQGVTSP